MNLKYYLRGLGIGIVVTAIIMSISTNGEKEKLSDAEIKARAAELGMIEPSGLLSDLEDVQTPTPTEKPDLIEVPIETEAPTATEEPEPIKTAEPTEEPEETATPTPTETPKPTEKPKATEAPKPTEKPEETEKPIAEEATQGEMITIKVNPGESSYTICKRLQENGLIASAMDFDTYLCDRGLDNKLRAGSFEIPENAEPDEIAEILTIK